VSFHQFLRHSSVIRSMIFRLANHGYIPRDGKNLYTSLVIAGAESKSDGFTILLSEYELIFATYLSAEAFNLTPDLLRLAAHLAILGSPSDDTFTLYDLAT
jgi:hypothetical protein